MIRTQKGELIATCNECGDEYYGGLQDSFLAFVEELKAQDWLIRKDEEEGWTHTCPSCRE